MSIGRRIFWGCALVPIGILVAMLSWAVGATDRTATAGAIVWTGGVLLALSGVGIAVTAPFGRRSPRQPPPGP